MNILLVNDDGIFSEGIKTLFDVFSKYNHNVMVVAPEKEESGTGHGVTLHTPLRVREVKRDNKFFGYAVNGKPSDCVKLAKLALYKDKKIDYIISGINNGENLGTDVLYSGTVSAALEGCLMEVKSISISLVNPKENPNYKMAAEFLLDYIEKIKDFEFGRDNILNINIPNVEKDKIKGIKYTKQSDRKYKDEFIERDDPRGNRYYWLGGEAENCNNDREADSYAVEHGYISVTPLNLNLTNMKKIKELKEITTI